MANDRGPLAGVEPLLTPIQVAKLFSVSVSSVQRWADGGLLPCIRTPGGHRRFRASDVRQALEVDGRQ